MQSLTCKPAAIVDSQGDAYHCAPAIVWVKDSGQTILVESEKECYWIIRGLEAMVWDLLTLNYTFEGIVGFLSLMLETPVGEATGALRAILQGWEDAGILLTARGHGRG